MEHDFRIDRWLIQPRLNAVVDGDQTLHLEPKVMEVLVCLAHHQGEVVSKEALIDAVWNGTFVTDSALTRCIAQLRKLFEDDPKEPTVIQTIPKGGYRLMAAVDLSSSEPPIPPVGLATRRSPRKKLLISAGCLAVGLVAAVVAWNWKRSTADNPVAMTRFTIPVIGEKLGQWDWNAFALSPDGARLAFTVKEGGRTRLRLRAMDRFESVPLEGSEEGSGPFFSPDGQWIGFFAQGKLKKVPVSGGQPIILADMEVVKVKGATWATSDTIVVGSWMTGLVMVSASGGKPRPISIVDKAKGESGHSWPEILPGAKVLIYTIEPASYSPDDEQIVAQSLLTGERRTLLRGGSRPRFVPGHLIYGRQNTLMAVPFDPVALQLKGEPVPVLEGVFNAGGGTQFDVSRFGSLVYVPGQSLSAERRLVWVDRSGTIEPFKLPPQGYHQPALSPDGQQVAVGVERDVWIYDIPRDVFTRLTLGEGNFWPIWTPDGRRVAFASSRNGPLRLFLRAADGSSGDEPLPSGEEGSCPLSFSPDGTLLAYNEFDPKTYCNIWIMPLQRERKPRPFLRTPYTEAGGMFSPDGRWIAYFSDRSGRFEIYVQPFPGPGAETQVSNDGGTEPLWARNGRELFYRNGDRMMAVDVKTSPVFSAGKSRILFQGRFRTGGRAVYDVTPDGQRFVMVQEGEQSAPTQINVVLGWLEELKRRSARVQH